MLKRHTDLDINPASDVRTRERGSSNAHTGLDLILNVNGRRREHFRQLLGHVGMFGGLSERGEHLASEQTRAVDRSRARVLLEQLADVIVES